MLPLFQSQCIFGNSSLHNLYNSYFYNLKFADPLNNNHYKWHYLRDKSSNEVTVIPVHAQSNITPNTYLPLHNNAIFPLISILMGS